MDNIDIKQAILVRDIIDMAEEHKDDSSVLEYISSICFTLDEVFDQCGVSDGRIKWSEVFSYYDQKYYNKNQGNNSAVDKEKIDQIYKYAVKTIKDNKQG